MRMLNKFLTAAIVSAGVLGAGAQSALADDITLRIGAGHPVGPTVYVNVVDEFFVPEVKRRVEAETDHTITFVEAYGGAIAGVSETLEAVQTGLLDIGAYCFCFEPAKLFLHNFPYYAPFGPQDSEQSMEITRRVYDRVPALTEIFEKSYGQMLLGLSGWDNYHLGTVKPWKTIADLKDVKIGGAGPNLPWLKYVGAVPVQSTLPEGYLALSTGVYDGWLMFPSAYYGFKFYEPAPVYTMIGFGPMAVIGLTMGTKSFNRLPKDVQKIIVEVGREYEVQSGISNNKKQKIGLAKLKEAGATLQSISEETRTAWATSLAGFPMEQAKEAESRGLPGMEVMKAYLDEVNKAGVKWSYKYSIK
ncbi:MAG: C4-dicarboxylate TRAP transporter substrate-binding protein [Rhizobiaceae bacterium]|nr:C4-dicarboxylate TRAP transporter substrate-binding protein [Rhizobiaceae bacterium]